MRMQKWLYLLVLLGIPGCGRVVDWGKDLVYQGDPFKQSLETARSYIRSIVAYDQLTTVASFDALWLSDDVRSSYVRLFVDRRGKSEEQYATIVRRQLEENNFVITFYVLCPYELSLGDVESEWMVFLRVGDKKYAPTEVKVVDLVPEYRSIFDKKYTRFKQAYMVKFDARDEQDNLLVTATTKDMMLVFRSLRKEVVLAWESPATASYKEVVEATSSLVTPSDSSKG